MAPSVLSSTAPIRTIAPTSRAPTSLSTPTSQIPIAVTGWYQYTASIGLSSIVYLPQGLNTVIDLGYTILQWTDCGCARYSWGDATHTFINDIYGYPIIYLLATVPSGLPTIAPSAPTATPSIQPSVAPIISKAPTNVVLSYNLIYHGGKINQVPVVKLIFWGPSWQTSPGDKISGMDTFYKGWTGSNYAKINTEFYGTNGQVSSSINYQGYVLDGSPANSIDGNVILSRVCANIPTPDPNGNGYYVVYTEAPRGSANYCGWHSYGYCNGFPVQFAFIFNLDGDNGCSVGSPAPNPGWQMSQGVHALAGVSAHELSEMTTDPDTSGGWFDSSGQENADKCAWTFPSSYSVFANGISWHIQGTWSNSAAITQTGYPTTLSNGATVKGCLG